MTYFFIRFSLVLHFSLIALRITIKTEALLLSAFVVCLFIEVLFKILDIFGTYLNGFFCILDCWKRIIHWPHMCQTRSVAIIESVAIKNIDGFYVDQYFNSFLSSSIFSILCLIQKYLYHKAFLWLKLRCIYICYVYCCFSYCQKCKYVLWWYAVRCYITEYWCQDAD